MVRNTATPTKAEVDEHEVLGHVQYRSWCWHCARMNATAAPHLAVPPPEDALPVISMDYGFMGQDDDDVTPMLVVKDKKSKSPWGGAIPSKGNDDYARQLLVQVVRETGYRRVVLKSDNEPAIVVLKQAARAELTDVECLMEESPVGDHQANGDIEVAVRELKRQIRVIKSDLEEKFGRQLNDSNPILAWIPRHACFLLRMYRVGDDGRTPYERLRGRRWRRPAVGFGERVHYRPVQGSRRKNDYEPRNLVGTYVGTNTKNSELLLLTPEGVVRGLSCTRMPEAQRWSTEELDNLKGLPWRWAPPAEGGGEARPLRIDLPEPAVPPPVRVHGERPFATRRLYILKSDIDRYGATPSCAGCHAQQLMQPARGHSDECRARIEEMLSRDMEGRLRLQKAQERGGVRTDAEERQPAPGVQISPPEAVGEDEPGAKRRREAASSSTPPAACTSTSRSSSSAAAATASSPMMTAGPASGTTAVPSAGKRASETPVEQLDVRLDTPHTDGASSTDIAAMGSTTGIAAAMCSTTDTAAMGSTTGIAALAPWKLHDLFMIERLVEDTYRNAEMYVSGEELNDISSYLAALSGVDVAEIFSPARFTQGAMSMGLRPGFAVDLSTQKKNGEYWDLGRQSDRDELNEIIKDEDPYLLTGSPPCEAFSALQSLNKSRVDPGVRRLRLEQGRGHLRTAVKCYRAQMARGRYFLHEHPAGASSWAEEEIANLKNEPGVFYVKGPMCRWGMVASDGLGKGYVRKETGWLTNSPELAATLGGHCSNFNNNSGARREWHRHVHLINGRARQAQVYPPRLVRGVLAGIRKQMREDGELNDLNAMTAGPVPEQDLFNDSGDVTMEYIDDVNGGTLDPRLVKVARSLEMDWVRSQGIYTKTPRSVCEARGLKPISLRWVDTNKGDEQNPQYSSRLVAREIKRGGKRALSDSELFSSMPPLEALKVMLSIWASKRESKAGRPFKLRTIDISRAHFYGRSRRELYIELPDEDATDGMVGLLQRSMYGTQDASAIWESDYIECLTAAGAIRGKSSGAIFYDPVRDVRIFVHGEDFAILGDDEGIDHYTAALTGKYVAKIMATVGPEAGDDKQAMILNRMVRWI